MGGGEKHKMKIYIIEFSRAHCANEIAIHRVFALHKQNEEEFESDRKTSCQSSAVEIFCMQ